MDYYEYDNDNEQTKKIILSSSIDSTPSLLEVIHNDNDHEHNNGNDCDDSSTEISESSDRFESVYDQLSDDEIAEIELIMNEWFEEYVEENLTSFSSPKFHDQMVDYVTLMLYDMWMEAGLCIPANYDDIREWTNEIAEVYYTQSSIPPRSLFHSDLDTVYIEKQCVDEVTHILELLKSQYQPKQKTTEWYEFRHRILTASNIWKAFGSDAQFNSLVYEKCKPFELEQYEHRSSGVVNNSNPMNWGIKYEPLSIQIYEKLYNTRVADFGCLLHPQYSYVGASPDGINVDTFNSELYGRMIEVKNIVNREINGIPLEPYWIQMQLQMEVCNLDTCDFIETRFEEFESDIEFYVYENLQTHSYYKGVILYFIPKSTLFSEVGQTQIQTPTPSEVAKYVYMPLDISLDKSSIDSWILSQKLAHSSLVLYHTIYWKLSEFSCVFVPRNREWFESVLPKIQRCWETIERERVEGYEHRASQSRKKVIQPTQVIQLDDNEHTHVIKNLPVSKSICLVKLDA
jgi:putative phage-type endonuclease